MFKTTTNQYSIIYRYIALYAIIYSIIFHYYQLVGTVNHMFLYVFGPLVTILMGRTRGEYMDHIWSKWSGGYSKQVERNRPPVRFTAERWNVAPTVEVVGPG